MSSIEKSVLSDHNMKVVAKVHSGLDVISYCNKIKVDVVVATTQLPDMELDKMLFRLMSRKPVPTLILKETKDIKRYGKEFDFGLIDTINVTYKNKRIQLNEVSLVTRINILSKLNLDKFSIRIDRVLKESPLAKKSNESLISKLRTKTRFHKKQKSLDLSNKISSKKLIVIGASTGGPKLLTKLIPKFPFNIPPVIIVQHIPAGFIEGFAQRMDSMSRVDVKIAETNDTLQTGVVYIAPGGLHLRLKARGTMSPRIEVFDGEPVNFVKPSVDVTLLSATKIYKKDLVSVILTGMGKDGLDGSSKVKENGGKVIALNEEDSDIYGMNKEVIEANLADRILPASRMVGGIMDTIRGN